MLVLAIDTSTPAVTAALTQVSALDVELVALRCTVDAQAHGELLAPAIQAVLTEGRARPGDLAAIVAGVGPGPFTGLRVGLVTAAAMAQALSIPAYGVCSLDAIGAGTAGLCLVATDARRKEIYWAVYRDGKRLGEPAVNRPADVRRQLEAAGALPEAAAGDGALRYADALALPVLDEPRYPQPVLLVGRASERIRAGAPADTLTPLYLRRPDAVEPGARKPVSQ